MVDGPGAKNIGIYNLHMPTRGGGEKLTLVLAEHLSRHHHVKLFHNASPEPGVLEETFAVDLSDVQFIPLDQTSVPLRVAAKLRSGQVPLSGHHYLQLKKLNLDLLINISYGSTLPCPATNGIFLCMFPHALRANADGFRRLRNELSDSIEKFVTRTQFTNWLDSYAKVIAISKYSEAWIERLWGRRAEVIYPPVDDMGPPAVKEKMILHVGRFKRAKTELHHDKAQEALLAAFREMTELHRDGWELHFAGTVGLDAAAQEFTTTLRERARGLPVRFHFNATFEQLRNLYRRAAIYWHATGVGADPKNHPSRQEHFGITTVEAMSAGSVPVVINSGGQRESVTNGVNGFCWNDIDGLMEQTRRLANDSELRSGLSRAAIESSKRFRRDVFTHQMDELLATLLNSSRD
jgi:glycosyltransferase involved in cell wall biosynthesis